MSIRPALFLARNADEDTTDTTSRWAVRALLAVLVGALASLLFALPQSASAATTTTHSRTRAEAQMAATLVTRLNAERRAHHLRPLKVNTSLNNSARVHDIAMARFDTLSHQLPHEPFFATRIRNAGYRYVWAGENVAWNSRTDTTGALQLENMMYTEKAPADEHRRNILSSHYTNVGVDVYVDRTNQRIWLTTDFGSH